MSTTREITEAVSRSKPVPPTTAERKAAACTLVRICRENVLGLSHKGTSYDEMRISDALELLRQAQDLLS